MREAICLILSFPIGLCVGRLCVYHQPYSSACVCAAVDAEVQQESLHRWVFYLWCSFSVNRLPICSVLSTHEKVVPVYVELAFLDCMRPFSKAQKQVESGGGMVRNRPQVVTWSIAGRNSLCDWFWLSVLTLYLLVSWPVPRSWGKRVGRSIM